MLTVSAPSRATGARRVAFGSLLAAIALWGGLALADRADAYVYWANANGTTIGRAALDGDPLDQGFLGGLSNPCGVAVDGEHLYWANGTNPDGIGLGTTIGRSDLDGSNADPNFIRGADGPCGVAADHRHVYWANNAGTTIGRADIDGSDVISHFIGGANNPCGVAVDDGHLYWANSNGDFGIGSGTTIGRADLDGDLASVDQEFIDGAFAPCGVAVNASHVFWTNFILGYGTTIGRAGIDGAGVNSCFIGVGCADPPDGKPPDGNVGVAVDDAHIYWANHSGGTIGRADLDGDPASIDNEFITGATGPAFVAVDSLAAPDPPDPPDPPGPPGPSTPPGGEAVPAPAPDLELGELRRNRRRGTASLLVEVPGPGRLKLTGGAVRTDRKRADAPGTERLKIEPRARKRKRLDRRGSMRVRIAVGFALDAGPRLVERRRVRLVLR